MQVMTAARSTPYVVQEVAAYSDSCMPARSAMSSVPVGWPRTAQVMATHLYQALPQLHINWRMSVARHPAQDSPGSPPRVRVPLR
jgi:hypothetical protein